MNDRFETLVQRLVQDEAFRGSFFDDPAGAVAGAGLDATPVDMAAVLGIPPAYFAEFARSLPARTLDDGTSAWRSARLSRRH